MTEFQPSKLGLISAILQSNVDKKSKPDEPAVELCNYTDVYYNDTITADLDFMKATASPDQIERLRLSEGDVIITKDSETADDIGIPAYVESTHDSLVCGYHLTILRAHPQKAFPKFLYYSMLTREAGEYWEKRANGVTRVSIPQQVVSSLTIPLPNLETQHRIADYLDKEISEMDALIAEFEGLVASLGSRRRVYAANLVHNDKYPLVPLSTIVSMNSGDSISSDAIKEIDDYPVYGGNGLRGYTNSFNNETERILIGRQGALCGNVHRVRPNFFATEHALVVKPKREVNLIWLEHALREMNLGELSTSVAQPGITATKVLFQRIQLPPLEEQDDIARRLQEENAEMDSLIEESTRLIENLKARKTALITEVVTGRKEV